MLRCSHRLTAVAFFQLVFGPCMLSQVVLQFLFSVCSLNMLSQVVLQFLFSADSLNMLSQVVLQFLFSADSLNRLSQVVLQFLFSVCSLNMLPQVVLQFLFSVCCLVTHLSHLLYRCMYYTFSMGHAFTSYTSCLCFLVSNSPRGVCPVTPV